MTVIEMKRVLRNMEPGEQISFINGGTYVKEFAGTFRNPNETKVDHIRAKFIAEIHNNDEYRIS